MHPSSNNLILEGRLCYNCNSSTTSIDSRYGNEKWFRYKDGYICNKCYCKLISNPKITPERKIAHRRKYGPRRITYQNCRVYLSQNFRTGQCNHCHKKIGDEYINSRGKMAIIRKTDLHHLEYHDDDIIQDTIELCVSCHVKETRRLKKW